MATFQIAVNNQVISNIDTAGNSQPFSAAQAPSVVADSVPPTLNAGATPASNLGPVSVGGGTSFVTNPA